jgi:hypothetical protein
MARTAQTIEIFSMGFIVQVLELAMRNGSLAQWWLRELRSSLRGTARLATVG